MPFGGMTEPGSILQRNVTVATVGARKLGDASLDVINAPSM